MGYILLVLHFWGDYVLQNDWMAANKAKHTLVGYIACLLHVGVYAFPFAFIMNAKGYAVIAISHFLIDKFSLAKYLVMLVNWNFKGDGFSQDKPIWMRTWLMIIVDNTLHISINIATYIIINF